MWSIYVFLQILEALIAIAGVIAAVIAARFYLQAQRHKQTVAAGEKVITLLGTSVEAWKARYEAEHAEHLKYRDTIHAERNESNVRMLSLTEENTALKAKTDLSPVIQFQTEQNSFNEKFLKALNAIVERLENLGRKKRKGRARQSSARRER